jgi:hypothetical protein
MTYRTARDLGILNPIHIPTDLCPRCCAQFILVKRIPLPLLPTPNLGLEIRGQVARTRKLDDLLWMESAGKRDELLLKTVGGGAREWGSAISASHRQKSRQIGSGSGW